MQFYEYFIPIFLSFSKFYPLKIAFKAAILEYNHKHD